MNHKWTLGEILELYDINGDMDLPIILCLESEDETHVKTTTGNSLFTIPQIKNILVESVSASDDALEVWLVTKSFKGEFRYADEETHDDT